MSIKSILIVEDESIIALDIQTRLIKLGYAISGIASTGEDAIRIADKFKPDLVLMDILLKGDLDGVEAARIIRMENSIPVIFLSSFSDEITFREAAMVSPHGYLIKPFSETELKTKIDELPLQLT